MKSPDGKAIGRIPAIDFTKGILVIFMIIYHSLNFSNVYPYRYMSFLPASFIMITGFLIIQHYFPKYGLDNMGFRTRLAIRSIKLLLIFTILNVIALMIWPRYYNGIPFYLMDFWWEWVGIYLLGSPKIVTFDILLPISYTLLLSIFIPRSQPLTSYFIKFCAISIFAVCILMENYGTSIYNLDLIGSGVIGMAVGLWPLSLINKFSRSWVKLSLLFVLYSCFVIFIGNYYFTQIYSTILILLIIYTFGVRLHVKDWFPKQTILLGQYSLLSYIIQIAYLKMFFIGTAYWNIDKPNIILTMFIIILITWGTVMIVDYAQERYKYVNLLYKAVFA